MLEDYPDHPGLLLSRGLSEALLSNGNLEVFISEMESSFTHAYANVSVTAGQIRQGAMLLRDWLTKHRIDALTALVLALEKG